MTPKLLQQSLGHGGIASPGLRLVVAPEEGHEHVGPGPGQLAGDRGANPRTASDARHERDAILQGEHGYLLRAGPPIGGTIV